VSVVDDILEELDAAARRFEFPVLDSGYVQLVGTRLTAFSRAPHWAIAIEVLGLNDRMDLDLNDVVYLYRNDVDGARPIAEIVPAVPSDQFSLDERDVLTEARTTVEARSGAVLELDLQTGTPLVDVYRAAFVAAPDALFVGSWDRVAPPLFSTEPLLKLHEWCHPDVAGGELPSEVEVFREVVRVVVDPSSGPIELHDPPNTSWEHWPEAGTL
jgi:hypothetical protein